MLTRERALKRLHAEIYETYRSASRFSSWRGWLEINRETASEKQNYDRAALITDLIRFDIQEPGPHTDQELQQLINEDFI